MTRPPFDPDPRFVDDDDLWDPQANAWVSRPSGVIVLLAGLAIGTVLGVLVGVVLATQVMAAPRPASELVVPAIAPERTEAPPTRAVSPTSPPQVGRQTAAPQPPSAARAGTSQPPTGPITEPAAVAGGLATWCAPTPTHCQSWGGDAHLAAVPDFHFGDRPYRVVVHYRGHRTTVTVVSFCACGGRIIDLSPAAFADLAPLSHGVIEVTVEDLRGPAPTPPPTDVEP